MAALHEFRLPDIGDFDQVDIVEVLVSAGDRVEKEQGLVVLESDKATMEVPSPVRGTVKSLEVSVGDQVSEGALIAVLEVEDEAGAEEGEAGEDAAQAREGETEPEAKPASGEAAQARSAARDESEAAPKQEPPGRARGEAREDERRAPEPRKAEPAGAGRPAPERRGPEEDAGEASADDDAAGPARKASRRPPHASPSVRRLARELGVDLALVPGSGRKGRIKKEDVQAFVKASLSKGSAAGVPIAGVQVAAPVEIDFSQWGETELQPLNRIRRLSSANLHRSWVTVPHVTQFDEADITELDAFRRSQKAEAERHGVKLTFLPFVIQAVAKTLKAFPHVNASLDPTGENLILKRYIHVGVAVDTEGGLVVPVVRDADRKGLLELAGELQDLSERARARRLRPADLQGGSFSISSLGGIGGTFFTPIVNHPEVAILGVSKMDWKPVWRGEAFVPRLVLPLSFSYDHRVIDGADAVRFTTQLAEALSDLRRLLL